MVDPGKTVYNKGEKLDFSNLLVEVTNSNGQTFHLGYNELIKDKIISVKENIKSKSYLEPGSGTLTLSAPYLNDININIQVLDNKSNELSNELNEEEIFNSNDNSQEKNQNILEENNLQNNKEENLFEQELKDNLKEPNLAEKLLGEQEDKMDLGKVYRDIDERFNPMAGIFKSSNLTLEEEEIGLQIIEDFKEESKSSNEITDNQLGFQPFMFFMARGANENPRSVDSLENKKFTIITRFDASVANGPIPTTQSFTIHLDDRLTVKDSSTLKPITDKNGNVIARPTYNNSSNSIVYNLAQPITEDIKVPLSIDVDYNVQKIKKLDGDATKHSIKNSITGLGVVGSTVNLPETIVDNEGNVLNTITEPGGHNVEHIIDQGQNYEVNMDASGIPVIIDKEMKAIDWTITFDGTVDMQTLGLIANATVVKGSGLGEIKDISLNGETSTAFTDNIIKGNLGIVDSKHYVLDHSSKRLVFKFRTDVTNVQSKYMIDFSVMLKERDKFGAVRLLFDKGFADEIVKEKTPSRVGMNNRTTILGEFTGENAATWTVTDGVCTGDDKKDLPLADRNLGGQ